MNGPSSPQARTIASRLDRNLSAISSPVRFWFARQKQRTPCALTRPRLRSRKRSGSPSRCDTHDVLELLGGDAELVAELVERLTGPEAPEHVLDAGPASLEHRSPEGAHRIDDHVGVLVGRHVDQPRVAIRGVVDATEVRLDRLDEDPLSAADDYEVQDQP